MVQGKQQPKFQEIRTFGSEIIMSRTEGWRGTDELRFHELCWHSQAELEMISQCSIFFFFFFFFAIEIQFDTQMNPRWPLLNRRTKLGFSATFVNDVEWLKRKVIGEDHASTQMNPTELLLLWVFVIGKFEVGISFSAVLTSAAGCCCC